MELILILNNGMVSYQDYKREHPNIVRRIIYVIWSNTFSSTTFAGVGIQNVVVLVNGKRVNVAIGNTNVDLITRCL